MTPPPPSIALANLAFTIVGKQKRMIAMSKRLPRPVCPNGHKPDHFIAPFPVSMIDGELVWGENNHGAIHADGEVCNSYYGGLHGVTAEERAAIAEIESVYCEVCLAEANWIHPRKAKRGRK